MPYHGICHDMIMPRVTSPNAYKSTLTVFLAMSLRGSGRRTCAASICLSVLCCVAVYVVTSDLDSAVIREEVQNTHLHNPSLTLLMWIFKGGDALVMESDFSNELRVRLFPHFRNSELIAEFF